MKRVWCVAWQDITPHMDGPKTQRTQEWDDEDTAKNAFRVLKERSARAPRKDLRIETRMVEEWERRD